VNAPALAVTMFGTPRPQGSVKPMFNKTTGVGFVKYADVTVEHRNRLILRLQDQWGDREPILTGVIVAAVFTFERPKSHYRTGKNAHLLRDSAPVDHIQAPDTDKLCRLVGDALETAGVLDSDSQICDWVATKRWGDFSGTSLSVVPKGVLVR
jgi:Holliday junction resolvase RusA-like endonuclease